MRAIIDDKGTITADPTPDDPTDDPIVIKPDENGDYPPTDIDGDGKDDEIEVGGGTITVTPGNGSDPTVILPGDVTVDEDGRPHHHRSCLPRLRRYRD